MSIRIRRTPLILRPDPSRVLLRPFNPGDSQRAGGIIARILAIPEERVVPLLKEISAVFSRRHQNIRSLFLERFEQNPRDIPHGSGTLRATAVDWLLFSAGITFTSSLGSIRLTPFAASVRENA
jgi:hypothetical protein